MQRSLIDQPLLDLTQIALLRDALGEEDLREMLSELPNVAGQACHKIRMALALNDLGEVRRLAHDLKGVASSFDAARLAEIAQKFKIEATSIASMMQYMPALADAIDGTLAALPGVESVNRT
jgi:HPt (histidine-containing phosphotransfer) domain-containing protein